MDLKKNWLEILIVIGILFSLVYAFYVTQGTGEIEAELVGVADSLPEIAKFKAAYPGSSPHLIRLAPKGVFSVKEGEVLDNYFERYSEDPLVGIIQEHEFDSLFPDIWILVYSPEPIRREGYVAPHPPNPAAYVFFDEDKEVLFVKVLE